MQLLQDVRRVLEQRHAEFVAHMRMRGRCLATNPTPDCPSSLIQSGAEDSAAAPQAAAEPASPGRRARDGAERLARSAGLHRVVKQVSKRKVLGALKELQMTLLKLDDRALVCSPPSPDGSCWLSYWLLLQH